MNDHPFDGPTPRGCLPSYPCPITPARPRAQDKLPEWDKEKAEDPQYLMDMAKKFAVLSVLKAKGGECTFAEIYAKAEELHCDVVTAAPRLTRMVNTVLACALSFGPNLSIATGALVT